MCRFLSCLLLKNGDIIAAPEYTDSHEDLIAVANIHDNSVSPKFARLEFTPPSDHAKIGDVSAWELNIDETIKPLWLDAEKRTTAREKLERNVTQMFIADKRDILLGGCWIFLDGAEVTKAIRSKIAVMTASAKLNYAHRVLVGAMWGSSRVGAMRESSRVGAMRESSQVGAMWGSSRVGAMRESSQVGAMRESSRVGEMWGSSRVGAMWESSQVGAMWESSQVGEMWGSSRVGAMRESSRVGAMRESSRVGEMRESSRVGEMRESSRVGAMRESSRVKTDLRKKEEPK